MNELIPTGLTKKNIIHEYDLIVEGPVVLTYIEPSENSNKFWASIPDGKHHCVVFWGKNGKPPQGSQLISWSDANIRFQEKINKGYEIVKDNILLNTYKTTPEWFQKIKGSKEFIAAVNAKIIEKKLSTTVKIDKAPRLKI
jgi:predicted DNA-binding WGR domain protein